MKKLKTNHSKATNDNKHDPFMWEFLYNYLNLWFEKNQIPHTAFNRVLHYTYELKNKPWLPDKTRTQDTLQWLRNEAASMNIPLNWL